MLKPYYAIVVSDYTVQDLRVMKETDAMVYDDYPTSEQITCALETYKCRYARVEKRYKIIKQQ